MIGISLCSGIGAPEVAAPWVDWRLASEIEPFPRAVLRERFGYRLPEDHNQGDPLLWGDMTEVTPDLLRSRGKPAADGPQYKAYGNSMCVNVMAWILSRMKISMEDRNLTSSPP